MLVAPFKRSLAYSLVWFRSRVEGLGFRVSGLGFNLHSECRFLPSENSIGIEEACEGDSHVTVTTYPNNKELRRPTAAVPKHDPPAQTLNPIPKPQTLNPKQ